MRLIVFTKIPERIQPIPLDIIDDRPSQQVLKDILILTELSKRDSSIANCALVNHGKKLDLNLSLTENSVRNGDCLHLMESNEQSSLSIHQMETKEVKVQETLPDSKFEAIDKKKNSKDRKKDEPPPISGKKIDFD